MVTEKRPAWQSFCNSKIAQNLVTFTNGHKFVIACGLMLISSVFWVLVVFVSDRYIQGDLLLYQNIASDLLAGKLPYRDRVLEYPPYAIPIFILPTLFGKSAYPQGFMLFVLLADWLIKLLLFIEMRLRQSNAPRAFLPLLLYCAATPFTCFFFLQRYDVWPALICLAAVWLFCSKRYIFSGLAVAIAIGVKLYPVVFVPALFVIAMRQGKGRRFLVGLMLGLLPIALLGLHLPWWRFAEFQNDRGLQVESLYASILWLTKLLGWTQLDWVPFKAWMEIQGPLASATLPWARALFVTMVAFSSMFPAWVATRTEKFSAPQLARLLLIPLLGFVAFNQVLSPQFMIWILPLAALGSLEGNPWTMFAILLATMLTPIIFPSFGGDYTWGLNLFETTILLVRNLTLIAVWILLIREMSLPRLGGLAKREFPAPQSRT